MSERKTPKPGAGPVVYRNGENGSTPKTRYSTIDLFNDLRAKHGNKGGNFYDWLRREREEKQQKGNPF